MAFQARYRATTSGPLSEFLWGITDLRNIFDVVAPPVCRGGSLP